MIAVDVVERVARGDIEVLDAAVGDRGRRDADPELADSFELPLLSRVLAEPRIVIFVWA